MHVCVLDDDHVIRVARLLLAGHVAGEATTFFEADRPDPGRLARIGDGLRSHPGFKVSLAEHAGRPAPDATALLFRRAVVDEGLLRSLPNLRFVQRLGERPEGIDLEAARERGIAVSCLPRLSLAQTAEHALMLMLASAKCLQEATSDMRGYRGPVGRPGDVGYAWVFPKSTSALFGMTLGIVGLGEVGLLVARRAAAFGMRIIYANRRRLPPEVETAASAAPRSLDELMAEADIVSLHARPQPGAPPLIGSREIAAMKPSGILVNVARGALVDEDALYEALLRRRIACAGLDVRQAEPVAADDRFLELPNVISTPHMAGGSRLAVLSEIEAIVENLEAVAAGKTPRFGHVPSGMAPSHGPG